MRANLCFRLTVALCALFGVVIVFAQAPAVPAVEEPEGLGFADIGGPLKLTDRHGRALCNVAWHALRTGSVGSKTAAQGEPRAVFLSWSDGKATARVAHGLGDGPVDALRVALTSIKPEDFPRNDLRWLKVDVVQTELTIPRVERDRTPYGEVKETKIPGFYVRESALPVPSLFGMSFSHASQLAFLPEQLLGRGMLDDKNRLLADTYAAQLGAENRLEEMMDWTRRCSSILPQKATFFETQAWFYDGVTCQPLYRGHRLYEDPKRDELAEVIVATARRLAGMIDQNGKIPPPVPQWFRAAGGKIRPFDSALAILALARAAELTDDPDDLLQAADRLVPGMIQQLHPLPKRTKAACFIEEATDDDQANWHTVRLETNALCTLALSTLAQRFGDDKKRYDVPLAALAHYLLLERHQDGSFVAERLWPSRKIKRDTDETASALTVCALLSLYDKTQMRAFREAALLGFDAVLPAVEEKPDDELSRDEWFLRAANRCFTYTREPRYAKQAERFAAAAAVDQMRDPPFPDLYGCVPSLPSATAAATRTGLIAVAARLMRDATQETPTVSPQVAGCMLLAEARPTLVAQLQGHIGPPEAMYLPEPTKYLGMFRDHVRAYGFDLQSQYSQILSLCEVVQTLDHLHVDSLSFKNVAASKVIDSQLAKRRQQVAKFPGFMRYFDGKLTRHKVEAPDPTQVQPADPDERPRQAPARSWRTTRPTVPRPGGAAGDMPMIRPVPRD